MPLLLILLIIYSPLVYLTMSLENVYQFLAAFDQYKHTSWPCFELVNCKSTINRSILCHPHFFYLFCRNDRCKPSVTISLGWYQSQDIFRYHVWFLFPPFSHCRRQIWNTIQNILHFLSKCDTTERNVSIQFIHTWFRMVQKLPTFLMLASIDSSLLFYTIHEVIYLNIWI